MINNQYNGQQTMTDDRGQSMSEIKATVDGQMSRGTGTDECPDCEKLQDQLTRLQAEFINYKRRVARDYQRSRDDAAGDVMQLLLPTLDNLEQALKVKPGPSNNAEDLHHYRQGIELIYENLKTTLAAEGLEQLELLHTEYDPRNAEALGIVSSRDFPAGTVLDVIQSGWLFRGRLLRPATVMVNRPASSAGDE